MLKESSCNAGFPGFNPWVRKISWGREWLPTLAWSSILAWSRILWTAWQTTVLRVAKS